MGLKKLWAICYLCSWEKRSDFVHSPRGEVLWMNFLPYRSPLTQLLMFKKIENHARWKTFYYFFPWHKRRRACERERSKKPQNLFWMNNDFSLTSLTQSSRRSSIIKLTITMVLDNFYIEKAKNELRETESRKSQSLAQFREWINKHSFLRDVRQGNFH